LITHPHLSAEVKEIVELYLYSPLWAFLVCSRINFTFTLTLNSCSVRTIFYKFSSHYSSYCNLMQLHCTYLYFLHAQHISTSAIRRFQRNYSYSYYSSCAVRTTVLKQIKFWEDLSLQNYTDWLPTVIIITLSYR